MIGAALAALVSSIVLGIDRESPTEGLASVGDTKAEYSSPETPRVISVGDKSKHANLLGASLERRQFSFDVAVFKVEGERPFLLGAEHKRPEFFRALAEHALDRAANGCSVHNGKFVGGCGSEILNFNFDTNNVLAADNIFSLRPTDVDVCTQLAVGSFGEALIGLKRGVGRAPGVKQSPSEKHDAQDREAVRHHRSNEQGHGPTRHAFLGLKVAASTLAFVGGLFLGCYGGYRGGYGVESLFNAIEVGGWRNVRRAFLYGAIGGLLALLGSFLSAGVITYWIAQS